MKDVVEKGAILRIEVWFGNGEFRAFPNVIGESVEEEDGFLTFTFGHDVEGSPHEANINLDGVNFIESWSTGEYDLKKEEEAVEKKQEKKPEKTE